MCTVSVSDDLTKVLLESVYSYIDGVMYLHPSSSALKFRAKNQAARIKIVTMSVVTQ